MRYAIVIEKGEGNFAAYVPDLPGCVATGMTVEDTEQYLYTRDNEIRSGVGSYLRHRDVADRDFAVQKLWGSSVYHDITVTYRGLRRIEELRDQLRHDRVLERFGILLGGSLPC